jgi:23S rRNA (uridine2552-2'-O)-methyltransferase
MKPGGKPDPYTARAHKEGFAARSVYKLEEIDRRCKLLRPGLHVLDLGAAPGSWTQWMCSRIGPKGRIVAVDLTPLGVTVPAFVQAVELDVLQAPLESFAALGPFDLLVSDMAPHTTGVRDADAALSAELVDRAMVIAEHALRPGGNFVAKIFQGSDFEDVRKRLRERFETVKVMKPEASRKESVEIFLVGLGHRAPAAVLPAR